MTRRMGRPPHPGPVTPAEERVLGLVRDGLSNAEIAVRIGVSVNTVRYHVANLLAKANVEDRRALARWEVRATDDGRERRWVGAALLAAGIGAVPAAAAAAVIAVMIVMGAPEPAPERASPEPAATGTATPTGARSVTAPPTIQPGPLVQGLSSEPRSTVPEEIRSLAPRPESDFGPWDGTSAMLFDTDTGAVVRLETPSELVFSPGGTRAILIGGRQGRAELWVIDLPSFDRKSLGPGEQVGFLDEEHVVTRLTSGQRELISLGTGARTVLDSATRASYSFAGYSIVDSPGSVRSEGRRAAQTWTVVRDQDGAAVLSVEAVLALPAGPDSIVVLTEIGGDAQANIFTVDLVDRSPTFVGTGRFGTPVLPIAASSRHVAWTDDYCGHGLTMVLDRASGKLTGIRGNYVVGFTADGLLALGPDLLVDPDTFEYRAVLPPVNPHGFPVVHAWSPGGRFAFYGRSRSGGTTCAPAVEPDGGVDQVLADGVVTAEEYAEAVSRTLACLDAHGLPHSAAKFDAASNQWSYDVGPTSYEKLGVHDECWARYEREVQAAWVAQR